MKKDRISNNEKAKTSVAYLSMEIALEEGIKTYAGGLGVLAGDLLRAASELSFPLVGVTLFNKEGYFLQTISASGKQKESVDKSDLSKLRRCSEWVHIAIGRDQVRVNIWEYVLTASSGHDILVYLLDTDCPENQEKYRRLSGCLYGGDREYRLWQEIVLGCGAIAALEVLGYSGIKKIHLNEGHGALAAISLYQKQKDILKDAVRAIKVTREKVAFTTHTPVAGGHDIFSLGEILAAQPDFPVDIPELSENGLVDFTKTALFFSSSANAVSRRHAQVSRRLFPGHKITSIVNGVSSTYWASLEMAALFDKYISGWRLDNRLLKRAAKIPRAEISAAQLEAKKRLLTIVKETGGQEFSLSRFTICFARRFAPYKQPEMLLADIDRLLSIQEKAGPIQIIYAGKAHPRDEIGKALIADVNRIGKKLSGKIPFVFLSNYNLSLAKVLVAGSDLWLNNPQPPYEASGTSGMKAAHNGVPQASTADGWWLEAAPAGWTIGEEPDSFYDLLEKEILPLFYQQPDKYSSLRRDCISLNASYFNTQRVLREYIDRAYQLEDGDR